MTIARRTTVVIAAVIACLVLMSPAGASGPYSSSGATVSSSTPVAGRSITVRAFGFRPNSTALITLDTSPTVHTSTRVNGAGKVGARLKIPATASGAHTIEVVGIAPDGRPRSVSIAITITRGSNGGVPNRNVAAPTAIAAGVALPAGAVLVVGSRRRRRRSSQG